MNGSSGSRYCRATTCKSVLDLRVPLSMSHVLSPISGTTFTVSPTLLKMGTRAVTFGTARLILCHVNANFFARGPKKVLRARTTSRGGPGSTKKWPTFREIWGAFGHRQEITGAIILSKASQTSLIREHTNEEDTLNKFAIVLYSNVEAIQYYSQSTIWSNGLSHRCILTSNIFGNPLPKILKVPRVTRKFQQHKYILLQPCPTMQKREMCPNLGVLDDDFVSFSFS